MSQYLKTHYKKIKPGIFVTMTRVFSASDKQSFKLTRLDPQILIHWMDRLPLKDSTSYSHMKRKMFCTFEAPMTIKNGP